MEWSRDVKLDNEQIRNLLAVASLPASGSTFFEDVEAFRSIMEYFGYEEDALKGFSDDNYLTTFSRNIIIRITPQGERIEDEVFVNIYRAGQRGFVCRTMSVVPEVVRKEILQACRLARRNVLEWLNVHKTCERSSMKYLVNPMFKYWPF